MISTLLGLQYLFLQSLLHITALPDLSRLTALRRVFLENMKGLKELSALAKAPALEELHHVAALGMQCEDYLELLKSPSLKCLSVGFGSQRKNEALDKLAAAAGISRYTRREFVFV